MIIDVHCHLFKREFYPEKVWRDMALDISKKQIAHPSIEEILESDTFKKTMNATTERLIKVMDNAGIDKSVVFGSDYGLIFGEPKKHILDFNKYIADGAKDYPDKLIPFFTIDVRRPKAAESFEIALTKWEMKGLKLHPFGYYPNSEECYKLYEIADKYQVPIITHVGYLAGVKAISARIEYFDAPTTDFPDLKFSIAHLNYGDVNTLGNMMLFKENIFCDFAGIGQNLMMYSPPDFYRMLRYLMNFGPVSSKVMFGSDWIGQPNSEWVESIKNLDNPKVSTILQNYGYRKFKSKEIKKMLGANAAGFLNL